MKLIPITKGLHVMVDDEDFEGLSRWKWYAGSAGSKTTPMFYAARSISNPDRRNLFMHRHLMNEPEGLDVDHKDGNTLNNQRFNLRICTRSENLSNKRIGSRNSSGFKGVFFLGPQRGNRWVANISVNRITIHLGCFLDPKTAAQAYDIAALTHFGEFAKTNKHLGLL